MKKMFLFSLIKSLFFVFFVEVINVPFALVLNMLVSVWFTTKLLKRFSNPAYPMFFGVMEVFLPVFSTLNLFFNSILFVFLKKLTTHQSALNYRLPFGEEHFQQFTTSQENQITHDYVTTNQNKLLYDSFQIEPFLDILEGHDQDLKINAIGKLSHIRSRESISLLKMALDDENYEVRYFASSSLSLMEKALIQDIETLNRSVTDFGQDFNLYTSRGLAYLNMYYLGIVDASIGHVFLEQSLNNFLYSLQLKSDQNYLFVKILEIYNYLKEYEKMIELIPDILNKNLDTEDRVKIQFYQAEAHFHLKKFEDLKKDCLIISQSKIEIPLMRESVAFWEKI